MASKNAFAEPNQQDFRALNQRGAQAVNLTLIVDLSDHCVKVLDKQDQPLPTLPAAVRELGECIRGDPFLVSFVRL